MTKKYFGTDGIRGAINSKNINGDMFFKFGLASGTYFKSQKKRKQTAIIAKDTRLSGYTLEPALVSGLASAIYLMMQGVQILRIHDVNETIQGLKIFKNIINN